MAWTSNEKRKNKNCSATLLFKMHQRAVTQNSSLYCCLSWWGTLRAAGFSFSRGKVPAQNNYQIGSCCELGVPPASGSLFSPQQAQNTDGKLCCDRHITTNRKSGCCSTALLLSRYKIITRPLTFCRWPPADTRILYNILLQQSIEWRRSLF